MRRVLQAAGAALWCGLSAGAVVADTDALGFIDQFKQAPSLDWSVANYDFTHPKFDTDWRHDQIEHSDGIRMLLSPKANAANRFDGASIRRKTATHYGRYEVTLQPARGSGVVTGFFTYSGPYYGTRHDEIDIEFLGKDTTQMHVAWFVDGQLTNHHIDLGFDAADQKRRYAFEWLPGGLRWFVDDRLIFEHYDDADKLPSVPGYLFANIWAADPSIASWAGLTQHADRGAVEYSAEISEISFQPYLQATR